MCQIFHFLKCDDLFIHLNCELICHTGDVFDDAFLVRLVVVYIEDVGGIATENPFFIRVPERRIVCVFDEPVFIGYTQRGIIAQRLSRTPVLRIRLHAHEHFVQRFDDIRRVVHEFFYAPVRIDPPVIEFFQ